MNELTTTANPERLKHINYRKFACPLCEMRYFRTAGYRCERCGHSWAPRNKDRAPKVCPNLKCKSPYWNKPRQIKKNQRKAGGRSGKKAS